MPSWRHKLGWTRGGTQVLTSNNSRSGEIRRSTRHSNRGAEGMGWRRGEKKQKRRKKKKKEKKIMTAVCPVFFLVSHEENNDPR